MARRNVGAVPWAEVANVEIAGRPAAAAGNLWDDDCAPASADWPLRAAVTPLLELAWRGLAGPGGTVARAEGRAGPGGRAERSGRLRPWCSRPERERRGKCGVLRVLLCCHGALRCCSKYLHAAQTPAARPLCASHCAARDPHTPLPVGAEPRLAVPPQPLASLGDLCKLPVSVVLGLRVLGEPT